ncbi:MAG: GDP-mannose 4,6-dehydratase [archaeon]|nr:GDP-mannose 4,6-dehydratase [archaeon]
MISEFWRNKKVLVTGGSGFTGSWLSERLRDIGASVTIIDLVEPAYHDFSLEKIDFRKQSIESLTQTANLFSEKKFEFVFHLASMSLIMDSEKNPQKTIEVNVNATQHLLDEIRKHECKAVIASSSRVYAESKQKFVETDAIDGEKAYDKSKSKIDQMSREFAKLHGLGIGVTRNANTFGGRDLNFSRIIPLIVSNVIQGKNPKFSNPLIERDFLFVKDAVTAYQALAENLQKKEVQGEAFNFGTGETNSLEYVADRVIQINGDLDVQMETIENDRKNESQKICLDWSKAKNLLGWRPLYGLDEGLAETVKWYREHFHVFK